MAVMIENLDADVSEAGPRLAAAEATQERPRSAPLDERELRELLARDWWRLERLSAD